MEYKQKENEIKEQKGSDTNISALPNHFNTDGLLDVFQQWLITSS